MGRVLALVLFFLKILSFLFSERKNLPSETVKIQVKTTKKIKNMLIIHIHMN